MPLHARQFDVDNVKELGSHYGVRAMPTFFFVRNGKVVDQVKGANIAAYVLPQNLSAEKATY